MSRWISLYWVWLLPLLATLGILIRLRALRLARRRELITRPAWRWMLAALAAAQLLIWLAQLAVVHQTNRWLPGIGLVAIGLMLFALRTARPGVHPGLHGFQRSLPRDGLDLIEREQHPRRGMPQGATPWLPLLPALGLLLYIASIHPERWLELAALALALLAPLLLVPYRRYWLSPLLLALPVMLLLAQAASLHSALPPGRWTTPVTGASCKGQLRVADHHAWCVNSLSGVVYQFDLRTGVVTSQTRVFEAVRVFAANHERSWIQQNPARGLVEVDAEAATPVHVRNTYTGAADSENRLWAIDVGSELLVYANRQVIPLRSRDGLLNNTASTIKVSPGGDVWVGSIGGVSWLTAGETKWQTLDAQAGLPGAVRNLAFAPDGTVWLLWQTRGGGSWGVIALAADGALQNKVDLGALTGLEAPLPEDALAVDGLGRVWFVSQSILRREKFLGLLTIKGEPILDVYSLGTFSMTGPYAYGRGLWEDSFGVAADGSGGIILFNGDSEPWRQWRP
jgi:sugar lactone lactonase YvrE